MEKTESGTEIFSTTLGRISRIHTYGDTIVNGNEAARERLRIIVDAERPAGSFTDADVRVSECSVDC